MTPLPTLDLFSGDRMILTSRVKPNAITDDVAKMFDYPFTGETTFEVPSMPEPLEPFRIGLIVGPSGSGKSTLLRRFGNHQPPEWKEDEAVVSHFEDAQDAAERFSAVGFNSIPSWLRQYSHLSTGEKFRADLARQIQSGAVVDEFTSVVDRDVAKACAYALRRYADVNRLSNVVLASCHYDIIEWLQPDWVFDTKTGQMAGRGLVRRPEIRLDIAPCDQSLWRIFRPHHYLDGNLNRSSQCWSAMWGEKLVGFASALAFPNGNFKDAWRGHRTVVLPDFQGLGIGARISDAVGFMITASGGRYFSKTSHPRLGGYRDASPLWRPTSKNHKARLDYLVPRDTKESGHKAKHTYRVCYSHEFVGSVS